ncbi:transcription factor HES-5-like [Thalassophryne amazonica]|uniref:transcription factor HES-5-like n=1 Tax=Thalassophryne amazonica TaxID=390379 RepID=UPI001471D94D|nr:transcription factor HES-5-like [Thalassophryne amazonica]
MGQEHDSKEHLVPVLKKLPQCNWAKCFCCQLRKLMVEKLRCDRINPSIDQLKSLLGPEFLRRQPISKQEKAATLEMAVSYLRGRQRQHTAMTSDLTTATDGYARCIQEAIGFLSRCQIQAQAHSQLISHFQGLLASGRTNQSRGTVYIPGFPSHPVASGKAASGTSCGVWRPW